MDGLLEVAQGEWAYLQSVCSFQGQPLRNISIKIDWDTHIDERTLAWARYTRIYQDDAWIPILLTEHLSAVDVEIGVNPNVQWTYNCAGSGWSLKTTLLHELLHAAGISSSASPGRVGYGETCTPTLMDTKMRLSDGSSPIDGCILKPGDLYVGSTLLHIGNFQQGVSYNHHAYPGSVMHPTPPATCTRLGPYEKDILETLGYTCKVEFSNLVDPPLTSAGRSTAHQSLAGRIWTWVGQVISSIREHVQA